MRRSVRMVEAKLPPGFRFHPRDDELVCDYLIPKWNSTHHLDDSLPILTQVDLNKCEPWDIPETACIGGKEWYFYSQRDRKYATGLRTNRATVTGYWKATGKDRAVVRKGRLVGMRKTLVFYQGRAPKGSKTEWVMHEFRVEGPFGPPKLTSPSKEDWVLCRVFYKNKDGGSGKSSAENDSSNSVDDTTGSGSSPMMDSYITFDQTQPNTDAYQQVPCFSMFSADNNNQNINISNTNPTNIQFQQSYEMEYPDKDTGSISMAEENDNKLLRLSRGGGGGTCDKKVLEQVLNQLTKMERCPTTDTSSPATIGEGHGEAPTSETYLSHLPLQHPTMWSHF